MQWIIKLQKLNKYVYSTRIFVSNPIFAKKFTDEPALSEILMAPEIVDLDAVTIACEDVDE